jgi:hypothetical protein
VDHHGCVHLLSEFARQLFAISPSGMTVVIADTKSEPTWVAYPGYLAPVSALGGNPLEGDPSASKDVDFEPEKSPTGPVSLVSPPARSVAIGVGSRGTLPPAPLDLRCADRSISRAPSRDSILLIALDTVAFDRRNSIEASMKDRHSAALQRSQGLQDPEV